MYGTKTLLAFLHSEYLLTSSAELKICLKYIVIWIKVNSDTEEKYAVLFKFLLAGESSGMPTVLFYTVMQIERFCSEKKITIDNLRVKYKC